LFHYTTLIASPSEAEKAVTVFDERCAFGSTRMSGSNASMACSFSPRSLLRFPS